MYIYIYICIYIYAQILLNTHVDDFGCSNPKLTVANTHLTTPEPRAGSAGGAGRPAWAFRQTRVQHQQSGTSKKPSENDLGGLAVLAGLTHVWKITKSEWSIGVNGC